MLEYDLGADATVLHKLCLDLGRSCVDMNVVLLSLYAGCGPQKVLSENTGRMDHFPSTSLLAC